MIWVKTSMVNRVPYDLNSVPIDPILTLGENEIGFLAKIFSVGFQ